MKPSTLLKKCINMTYIQAENGSNYALEQIGHTLYIYFEHSNGVIDWKSNFDFPSEDDDTSEPGTRRSYTPINNNYSANSISQIFKERFDRQADKLPSSVDSRLKREIEVKKKGQNYVI